MTVVKVPFKHEDDDLIEWICDWLVQNVGGPAKYNTKRGGMIGPGWTAIYSFDGPAYCVVEIENDDVATLFALRWIE